MFLEAFPISLWQNAVALRAWNCVWILLQLRWEEHDLSYFSFAVSTEVPALFYTSDYYWHLYTEAVEYVSP